MKDTDNDRLLGQHLSGDPPRQALRDRTLRDSTAAFVQVRRARRARRTLGFAAAAVLIVGIAFLGGRLSAPAASPGGSGRAAQRVVKSGTTAVPNELLAWLDAARLFRQLGMEDRMARAVERAGRLLPAGTFVTDSRTLQVFAATPVENQQEHPQSMGTSGPHPSTQSTNRILAQSFWRLNHEN